MSRTALRTAAALGAATALTVAGAGVAMAATTSESAVDGNSVSVTFTWESEGLLDRGDACGAALFPPAAAAGLASAFAQGDLEDVFERLADEEGVQVLYYDGLIVDSPAVALGDLQTSATVEANDVPTGVYALAAVCASAPTNPTVEPFLIVGDPVEAIMGSVASGSEGDLLGTASAMLGGADGEAEGGLGLDTLSSALGGGAEGELDLAVLSSALGETDTEN